MPTYEYECSKGHHFEVEQPITAEALKRCRICRAKARRLISASHFILKGSGWYADGYGSAKPKSGGDSGSDAKPAAKPEGKAAGGEKPKSSSKPGSGSAASAGS